ncbi:unnamed protein product [Urochloa decumbens]|uniref:RING-type E3 ubiquitin transferase n=1 Tax=Urochloa decumbens TaxID=240449 RepID=A0ABC9ABQ0_9POAL
MAAHNSAVCRLCVVGVLFLLLVSTTITNSSAASTPEPSSLCATPSDAPKRIPAGNKDDALPLLRSLELNSGYFFGGEDIHFAKDESNETSYYSYVSRSFSLLPLHVGRTANSTLFHVGATLTLSGGRAREYFEEGSRRRRHHYVGDHTVTFYLDGYYYSNTAELCMAGSGSYHEDDGSNARLLHVGLHLRLPNPASIADPFVTGRLRGAGVETISLVAYAEGDAYRFGESAASCPPPSQPPTTPRGGKNVSCAHLKGELVGSYTLQHASSPGGASPLPGLRLPALTTTTMHVGQVQCAAGGGVRAYAAFYNGTAERWRRRMMQPGRGPPRPPLVVGDEVVVAEGRWDPARRMLCLRACRVVRSESEMAVAVEKDCGVGMSFWFPGVWTIRDRSAVAGVLWNASRAAGTGSTDGSGGVISASSTSVHIHRGNFSDVKYIYNDTMVEEAKKHYLTSELSSPNGISRSFTPPNYTYQDFEFRFYDTRDRGHGDAYPVTVGSTIVYGDQLVAEDSFSRDAVIHVKKHELLNVSYDINMRRVIRPKRRTRQDQNVSYSIQVEERKMKAEGVFDPKTGILCMAACQEHNSSVTDCQILITVHFASLDPAAQNMLLGHGRGAISSLRNKTTDPLFFDKIKIRLFGMYRQQASESVSRMDWESIMLVVSTSLPCVFSVLQIFHVSRRPEAAAATSITMLVVLSLGYVVPLVLSSEALFLSRRRHYYPFPFESYVPYELSQAMMRAPTLIAMLLQLRLIQLAWKAREKMGADGSTAAAASAAERRALWLCVPLYLIGGAVTVIAHFMNARRAAEVEAGSVTVRLGPAPATLWEDLVSSAGLALDAFLLPQVAMNVFVSAAGAGVTAALSPWFYAGGTVVRAVPHVYDVIRAQGYVPSIRPSYVYANPRYDRFGVAWDIAVPCGAALLCLLLFLQQRVRLVAAPLFPPRRRLGEYEMVSNL